MKRTIAVILAFFVCGALPAAFQGRCTAQTLPATQPAPPTSRGAAPLSEDELPDDVLHGDIYAVAVLDFAVADKTAWSNAVTVIMGGAPTTRPLASNAQ